MAKRLSLNAKRQKLEELNERLARLQQEKDSLADEINKEEAALKAREYDDMVFRYAGLGMDFKQCGNLMIDAVKTGSFDKLEKYMRENHVTAMESSSQQKNQQQSEREEAVV